MSLSIITTKDGSHTIKNESTGDTYHSVHGAVQESNHVFIKSGLQCFLELASPRKIKILEVGFGTGLNAYLTIQAIIGKQVQVDYVALEPHPLEAHLVDGLNYGNDSNFKALHHAQWNSAINVTTSFTLTKIKNTIQSATFDLVYYDAFAPNTQPEMWTFEVFQKIKSLMAVPSLLVTYCAKGQVKRDLKSAGFIVESIPGPPGKREMVRARIGFPF